MKPAGALAAIFAAAIATGARADGGAGFTDAEILGSKPALRIESVSVRYTRFDQQGTGYQSRAGKPEGPGDETVRVEQPQIEVIAKQGDKVTHRLWVPIDVVTAASPDAIDVVSGSSRRNEAASVDWTTTYKYAPDTTLSVRSGMHNEENWRSWNVGFGYARSFAEDNTVVEVGVNEIADWFDKYLLSGKHDGHTARSSLSVSAGLTQILSPTTIAHVDYGLTLQRGQLSNGWNTVPLRTGEVALEIVPKERLRHALVARVAQFLPWDGAAQAFYRFYTDGWGIRAHTLEVELHQRVTRSIRARLNYRFHTQTAPSFFHTRVDPGFTYATADSDLADLDAHTIGFKITAEARPRFARLLRFDVGADRYFRSNDLRVSVFSCGLSLFF